MKKIYIPLAIVVIVVIGVVVYLSSQNSQQQTSMMSDESAMVKDQMPVDEGAMMEESEAMQDTGESSAVQKEGSYVEFANGVLENSADTKRVLYFYANWCPTCRPSDQNFTQNEGQIPNNTTVIRVNYNDTQTDEAEKELAKKYGVTYQHTFVQLDGQGNAINRWNGGDIDELLANIQ